MADRLLFEPSFQSSLWRYTSAKNVGPAFPSRRPRVESSSQRSWRRPSAHAKSYAPELQAWASADGTETVEDAQLAERKLSSLTASTSDASIASERVDVCRTVTLPLETSYELAVSALQAALKARAEEFSGFSSGVLRIEVPLALGTSALRWLKGQQGSTGSGHQLGVYFSPRTSSAPATPGTAAAEAVAAGTGAVAGIGAAWDWQGREGEPLDESAVGRIQAFLSTASPRVRALGGSRFDNSRSPSAEWKAFGSYFFVLPRIEFLEAATCNLLAVTVAWRRDSTRQGLDSLASAVLEAQAALKALRGPAERSVPALQIERLEIVHRPDETGWRELMEPIHDALGHSEVGRGQPDMGHVDPFMALQEYESNGQGGLDALLANLQGGEEVAVVPEEAGLVKVVLARRSDVAFRGRLCPLDLLQTLQERDPRAFQLLLQLPSGATFLGSTPELLYERSGSAVASEAVAGTRPRGPPGDVERDFWLAFDLLRNPKDHAEFSLVRDWVRDALKGICTEVKLDTEKSVLKQGPVQHLYGRLSGKLRSSCNDAHLLAALHPTPAVCGRPQKEARSLVMEAEPFDRGFYAGPFGWMSGAASEFAVAIRSALLHPSGEGSVATAARPQTAVNGSGGGHAALPQGNGQSWISLYAGVGIVKGSRASSEWQELELKVKQFTNLLRRPTPLQDLPNINMLWARLLVEELCRLGVNTFCVAPGSRSSPLTLAVALQPTAQIISCIDERSMAFWALGYGRAARCPAAIITSSGTAVANLYPAVVEASQSQVPLLVLSADRPGELRDTGANQTIDQVKMFGGYTNWAADLPSPSDAMPARIALTAVDTALRYTQLPRGGPVHLNCQFREPLGPQQQTWALHALQGLDSWQQSCRPFSQPVALTRVVSGTDFAMRKQIDSLRRHKSGLIVVGEQLDQADSVACLQIARCLGWPLAADSLSGLSIGAAQAHGVTVLRHLDLILLEREQVWPQICPDAVLQLGGRITSKRTNHFLQWAALERGTEWVFVGSGPERHDEAHCTSARFQMTPTLLAASLKAVGCGDDGSVYGGRPPASAANPTARSVPGEEGMQLS